MDTIKDRVKKYCDDYGITIAQLEKNLGFGNGTIARWDVSQPRSDKLSAVAKYFHIPISALRPEEKNPDTERARIENTIVNLKRNTAINLFDRASPEDQDFVLSLLTRLVLNQEIQDEH